MYCSADDIAQPVANYRAYAIAIIGTYSNAQPVADHITKWQSDQLTNDIA